MSCRSNDGGDAYSFHHKPRRFHNVRIHHLICRTCGKITPFKDDLLEELERRIEEEEGFHVLDHELKFYGQCMDCQKKAKQRGEHMEV